MDSGKSAQDVKVSEPPVDLGRRRISVAAAMALLGGAALTLSACGGGGASPGAPTAAPAPPAPCGGEGGICGAVSVDPLHQAAVTAAQLSAGGALTLDITGFQQHGHLVELSAEEVAAIRNRQRVEKTSSLSLGHQHTVTFN